MIKYVIGIILMLSVISSLAQTDHSAGYNKVLADSLGADDYGMKMYALVILKTGPAKMDNKATRDSLFRGHMQNIGRLVKQGQLVVAGPVEENAKNIEGIFILNVKTVEEAKRLLVTDPAIKSGLLDPEIYQWYGSAALPMYLQFHPKVQKKSY